MRHRRRSTRLISIIALVGFACYAVAIVVISVSSGEGHGSVYWTSIGLIVLLALAAIWLSARIRRRGGARPADRPND